jgi:hypothetical protein
VEVLEQLAAAVEERQWQRLVTAALRHIIFMVTVENMDRHLYIKLLIV